MAHLLNLFQGIPAAILGSPALLAVTAAVYLSGMIGAVSLIRSTHRE